MSWQTELVSPLRLMIDDPNGSSFTNGRLQDTMILSAQFLQQEVSFVVDYTVDIAATGITPDPTDSPKDDAFTNLWLLKTACMMDRAKARTAAGNAVLFREFSTTVDLKGPAAATIQFLKEGWCKAYDIAKQEYNVGSLTPGRAIVAPFRVYGQKLAEVDFR